MLRLTLLADHLLPHSAPAAAGRPGDCRETAEAADVRKWGFPRTLPPYEDPAAGVPDSLKHELAGGCERLRAQMAAVVHPPLRPDRSAY